MTLVRNRPTPEGKLAGAQIARFTDKAEVLVRKQFPNHAERCKSCAYRAGTIPNGCPDTVIDATKCAFEGRPFYCHERFNEDGTPQDFCAGWLLATTVLPKGLTAPFPYSDEIIEAAKSGKT
jgi:hypothetical protein